MDCCGSCNLPDHENNNAKGEVGNLVNPHLRTYFLGTILTVHIDLFLNFIWSRRKGTQVDLFPSSGEVGQEVNFLCGRGQ
jgi:hypothetical protein